MHSIVSIRATCPAHLVSCHTRLFRLFKQLLSNLTVD